MSATFPRFPLRAALLCLALGAVPLDFPVPPAFSGAQSALAAPPEAAEGPGALTFQMPAGFVDCAGLAEELLEKSRKEACRSGVLLRLYLPAPLAEAYRNGHPEAVTRQVAVYAPLTPCPGDRKSLDLLERALDGAYAGFARVPRMTDKKIPPDATPASLRADAIRQSLTKGVPLLFDPIWSGGVSIRLCLLPYPTDRAGEFLTMALATALAPVADAALFVTASSILRERDAEEHLDWVRDTAELFAYSLISANRR